MSPLSPVIHLRSDGRMANRMLQYMAAMTIAAQLPDCRLSNVELPDWGIHRPVIQTGHGRTRFAHGPTMRLDLPSMIDELRSGAVTRLEIHSYALHMDNFMSREVYDAHFRTNNVDIEVLGPEWLTINIRAGEVLAAPHPDYTLLPFGFYRALIARTGLKPVFMGQIGADPYTAMLRAEFPDARFIPSQTPLHDFELLRRAANIVPSISTFSWLASWLSHAQTIHLPVTGFLNPAQSPLIDLLPLQDKRYRFYLFPLNYAVPLAHTGATHRSLEGAWRLMQPAMIEELRRHRPRFPVDRQALIDHFDADFYLAANPDVKHAVDLGHFGGRALNHYDPAGYAERRDPFRLDKIWYAASYPLAAIEVGQGDFDSFHHHYLAVGRDRGYLPVPPG